MFSCVKSGVADVVVCMGHCLTCLPCRLYLHRITISVILVFSRYMSDPPYNCKDVCHLRVHGTCWACPAWWSEHPQQAWTVSNKSSTFTICWCAFGFKLLFVFAIPVKQFWHSCLANRYICTCICWPSNLSLHCLRLQHYFILLLHQWWFTQQQSCCHIKHIWGASQKSNWSCVADSFGFKSLYVSNVIHTFSAFWLWSSVVSVLISVTTDMSPTGDLLVTLIFLGEVSSWACSEAFTCCARPAHSWRQHTLWGNKIKIHKISLSGKQVLIFMLCW